MSLNSRIAFHRNVVRGLELLLWNNVPEDVWKTLCQSVFQTSSLDEEERCLPLLFVSESKKLSIVDDFGDLWWFDQDTKCFRNLDDEDECK